MELKQITIVTLVLIIILVFLILNYLSIFRTKKYTFNFNGINREYLLHLPSGYSSLKNYPLVVALHGFGDHPRFIEQYSGLSRLSDKEKFIVVYPYGSQNKTTQKFSWNGGSCCGEALNKNIDDVMFINNLVDALSKKYNVDSKKVYLTGFSNGAILTYRIAAQSPEKFAAFAVVAGSIGGKTRTNDPYYTIPSPKKPVPILIMHGKKDGSITYLGGQNEAKNASFTSFAESTNFWLKNNKAKDKEIVSNEIFIHEDYKKNPNGERVEVYTVKESGHVWFGGVMEIKNNLMGKSISATNIIWDFFKNNHN